MKNITPIIHLFLLTFLSAAGFLNSALGQEMIIPDPGLDAAIRQALQKTSGPLTDQDMLSLTNLNAVSRNISNLQGLSAARNLTTLSLDDNHLTYRSFPDELANLTSLAILDLSENPITNLTLPSGLTNMTKLRAEQSGLTNLTLPAEMSKLAELHAGFNQLPSLNLPEDMTNLSILSVYLNQLTNLALPPELKSLSELDLAGNRFSDLALPAGLTNMSALIASDNRLTRFTVPADMTNLTFLRLNGNQLTNLTLTTGLANLTGLFLQSNHLASLTIPPGLNHLNLLDLTGNQLTGLALPAGLTSLTYLNLNGNQLTNLTLPADMQQLIGLFVSGNPLVDFVLSEPLATTGLASAVDSLKNQGVNVFAYPLTPRLFRIRQPIGAFQFALSGPPGIYSFLASADLASWTELGVVANRLGNIVFTDTEAHFSAQKFYRALLQTSPTNMVFVPPNTFTMGSPTNEPGRSIFEGPQTVVTLTRGFWIGKYEVTQGEYLEIMNENPSNFPGDLSRPVSSVSWIDATNYCWKLTQRELAAGRIPAGSHYRLPTEAEWECAARAGTSTQFSYGDDDPNYGSLKNYAWYLGAPNSMLTVYPVGQKLPNPWGLYDMYGNVWEWCLDWYGDQLGGTQTDPTGPAGPTSNATTLKVMRGGAYDYPDSSCRSASRLFFTAFLIDSDLGFRVVLDVETKN